jgi:hypothetical protein
MVCDQNAVAEGGRRAGCCVESGASLTRPAAEFHFTGNANSADDSKIISVEPGDIDDILLSGRAKQ